MSQYIGFNSRFSGLKTNKQKVLSGNLENSDAVTGQRVDGFKVKEDSWTAFDETLE